MLQLIDNVYSFMLLYTDKINCRHLQIEDLFWHKQIIKFISMHCPWMSQYKTQNSIDSSRIQIEQFLKYFYETSFQKSCNLFPSFDQSDDI